MDYGRLAYLKAEELEGRLNKRSASSEKRMSQTASFYPRTELYGGYIPCVVSGSDCVGMTAALTLRAPAAVSGAKVYLYCGDKLAAYTTVTLGKGESGRYTLLAAVYPSAGESLMLRSDGEGLILEEFSLLIDGNGASISAGGISVRCDHTAQAVFAAYSENGCVYIAKRGGKKVNCIHGHVFDISAYGGCVYVAAVDDVGNLWGVRYDTQLNETARAYLGDAPERVALGLNPYGLTIAGLWDKEVYLCECEEDFSGRTDWLCADFGTRADDLYFGKQSLSPALFLSRDGHIYAKLPVPQLGARDCVTANITLSFE